MNRTLITGLALNPMLLVIAGCTLGYGHGAVAQDIDQQVAKGGLVQLHTSYQLSHTLLVSSNTQLSCDPGVTVSDLPSASINSVIQLQGQGASVQGCGIYANHAPVLIVIGAHSSGVSLINNHLSSFDHAHAILIDAPDIHNLNISGNTVNDVKFGILQNVHAADLTNVTIDGNNFSNVWADAIELNNPVTNTCCGIQLKDIRASGIVISHNKFRVPKHEGSNAGAGFCVGVAGAHDIDISDNDCVAWNAGVHVEDRAYNIRIVGNTISTDDPGTNGELSAIWIIDGRHLTISQNTIQRTTYDGIHLDYDPTDQASNVEIAGNKIIGCGRYGLYISGGSLGPMNTVVHDNSVSGCAKPILLVGKLKSLSIRSNQLEAKNGCVFDTTKNSNKGEVDIKNNRDPVSGADANATCGG